jgi:hypothetical protein
MVWEADTVAGVGIGCHKDETHAVIIYLRAVPCILEVWKKIIMLVRLYLEELLMKVTTQLNWLAVWPNWDMLNVRLLREFNA